MRQRPWLQCTHFGRNYETFIPVWAPASPYRLYLPPCQFGPFFSAEQWTPFLQGLAFLPGGWWWGGLIKAVVFLHVLAVECNCPILHFPVSQDGLAQPGRRCTGQGMACEGSHHCAWPKCSPRPGEARFLLWLLGHRRLKARRVVHLSARAGHLILLWSRGCWGTASTMPHIFPQAGPCSSALRASWDLLPGAARTTATAHSHQCLYWVREHTASPASPASSEGVCSSSGPGAQLVRVMRASTTFPMCSRRLRSAAAREISISVICRERAATPAAAAEQHSGGCLAPTPQASTH